MIAAWVSEKDLACEQLAIVVHSPGDLSYGNLKLLPLWDPLRSDPRFEQIVASLAPIPAGPSYGDLRFNPCWDSLRCDKRFDKIVAAAKAASR
jgi:hypothetical protein